MDDFDDIKRCAYTESLRDFFETEKKYDPEMVYHESIDTLDTSVFKIYFFKHKYKSFINSSKYENLKIIVENYINTNRIKPKEPKVDITNKNLTIDDGSYALFQTAREKPKDDGYYSFIPAEIDKFINNNLQPTFSERLFQIIREKKLNEVEVYKKADLDRKHFSKIRSNYNYQPKKDTVVLLCLSMKLTLDETNELLHLAGLSFSKNSRKDLISEYFFKNQNYNIFQYRAILDSYNLL